MDQILSGLIFKWTIIETNQIWNGFLFRWSKIQISKSPNELSCETATDAASSHTLHVLSISFHERVGVYSQERFWQMFCVSNEETENYNAPFVIGTATSSDVDCGKVLIVRIVL